MSVCGGRRAFGHAHFVRLTMGKTGVGVTFTSYLLFGCVLHWFQKGPATAVERDIAGDQSRPPDACLVRPSREVAFKLFAEPPQAEREGVDVSSSQSVLRKALGRSGDALPEHRRERESGSPREPRRRRPRRRRWR